MPYVRPELVLALSALALIVSVHLPARLDHAATNTSVSHAPTSIVDYHAQSGRVLQGAAPNNVLVPVAFLATADREGVGTHTIYIGDKEGDPCAARSGSTVVDFGSDDQPIVAYGSPADSFSSVVATTLAPGSYRVTLTGKYFFDGVHGDIPAWFITMQSEDGVPLSRSPITKRNHSHNVQTHTVGVISVYEPIAGLRAVHADYFDERAASIMPYCARFEPIEPAERVAHATTPEAVPGEHATGHAAAALLGSGPVHTSTAFVLLLAMALMLSLLMWFGTVPDRVCRDTE
jgi:hypothetical protein